MADEASPADAARALRARGIDNVDELLAYGTADEIMAACRRWDGRPNVGPGLLARWIRDRDFTEPPRAVGRGAQFRARFDEYATRYPPGSITESHHDLLARRWPDDLARTIELGQQPCPGQMRVVAAMYPVLEMECDTCGFGVGLTPRHLHVLSSGLFDQAGA